MGRRKELGEHIHNEIFWSFAWPICRSGTGVFFGENPDEGRLLVCSPCAWISLDILQDRPIKGTDPCGRRHAKNESYKGACSAPLP